MLNPFKVYALAADARRAEAILREQFYGGDWSLSTMAQNAVNRVADLEQISISYFRRVKDAEAKIAKMQSGLKRGTTPKRGPEVSA